MLSTPNGCMCHLLDGQECISCHGRAKRAAEGLTCKKCRVGVHTKDGDYEYMQGMCTNCHYNAYPDNGSGYE